METVRAVLFDAGNTLIRVKTSVGQVYAAVARRHGVDAEGDVLDRLFREAFFERRTSFIGSVSKPHSEAREKAWWKALVEHVFRAAGLRGPTGDSFEAFFDDLYATFESPEVWEVFPDVFSCLDALGARGMALAVVSNWDSRLHAVLRGLGLGPRFRFVLTSAEFGAEKPDPGIFLEALRRLDLPPDEVVHVGDLLREDILGAAAAGIRSVLVDRERRGHDGHPFVLDLGELPGRLA
jgi:putative hydrolase of the HAD superfamily